MIRIALIEFSYHAELLNSLSDLFTDSDIRIDFYLSEKVYQSLSSTAQQKNNCSIIPGKTPLADFLKNKINEFNTYDLVFFNTVADQYWALNDFKLNVPTILRIHNVHATFSPFSHISIEISPYFIWKAFSYFFRRQVLNFDWYFQYKFLRKIDFFSFLTEDIEQYAKKWVNEQKIAPRLPSEICKINLNHLSPIKPQDTFQVVVPGEINRRKRDYYLLYRALKHGMRDFDRKVNITLLGQPRDKYGKNIVKLFHTLSSNQLVVNTFQDRVSEQTFEMVMQTAHLIVAPVKIKTTFAIYGEEYGLTKISGAQSDAIRYGKSLLVPQGLNIDAKLNALVWKYKNESELAALLKTLVNTNTINEQLENQVEALSHFKREKLLPSVVNELTAFKTRLNKHQS